MKKLISVLAVLAIFGAAAFAGPYFEVGLNPLAADTALTFGWYEEANNIDLSGVSITGDIYAVNENLWVYPTPWMFGGELGVGSDWVWFSLASDITLRPQPDWTEKSFLDLWQTTLKVTGYPSDVVTIWGSIEAGFDVEKIGSVLTGIWNFVPIVGIRCEW